MVPIDSCVVHGRWSVTPWCVSTSASLSGPPRRRAGGLPGEFSLARVLNKTETMQAEEAPIRSSEGEVETLVDLQDLTALEETERLWAEFLGMVSHELLEPLTSVKVSAATLVGLGFSKDSA